ncbi:SUKH-4 family immunity protein [Streptomyces sp. NPDC003393]
MQFELTEVSGDGVSVEVPVTFFSYRANDHLERLMSGEGEIYYQFWRMGHHVGVYLQQSSGIIFAGASLNGLVFANSSIELFNECVKKIIDRFPFYAEGSDLDDCEMAAEDLEGIVRGVDPSAANEGTFWSDFITDVSIGDYPE